MPSTTEMLDAFGVFDRVVGVSVHCDEPDAAADLPSVGSGMDPDLETLLSLRPDLVVGTVAQRGYDFVAALRRVGVTVFLVDDRSLETLFESMIELGRAVGAEDRARTVVAELRGRLEAVAEAVRGRRRPRVLVVFDHDPVYAAGPDTFVDSLVTAAGGDNVLDRGSWVQLDREQVIRLAPDVILEPSVGRPRGDALAPWRGLERLPAVRQGRVYRLSSDGIVQPGPSVAEAAEEIARLLYPVESGQP
jgi:iron complex transport system substrate-binding protein